MTGSTLQKSNIAIEQHLIHSFQHASPVMIGALSVTAFRKSHDAADPHSFIIRAYGISIGIITDIGYACKEVVHYFSQCHAAFLESNYCDDMLANGYYPLHLKRRIAGNEGHLSNTQALELFRNHRSKHLQLLILSHLSKNNNKPELAASVFQPHAGNTQIVVASRYEPTPLFCIEQTQAAGPSAKKRILKNQNQLSLF